MDIPTPFPDISVDLRREENKAADLATAERQATRLANTADSVQARDAVIAKLTARRPPGALQLEPVEIDGVPVMYTAARQIAIRRLPAGRPTWKTEATQILGELNYAPAQVNAALAELSDTLVVLESTAATTPSGRRSDVAAALQAAGLGADASGDVVVVTVMQADRIEARVVALADGSGGDVVVKAPGGPGPTEAAAPAPPANFPLAAPIVVAVIDTGITPDPRPADGLLDEVLRTPERLDPLDAFGGAAPSFANGRLDFAAGHGTFAAGIVRLVDPLAEIRVYRAIDSDGFGTEVDIAAAIVKAVRQGAHVVNLSLGTHTDANKPLAAIEAALDWIGSIDAARRPVVVAAAGNAGSTREVWPAASKGVLAVAALDPDGPAAWSSHGGWVDFSTIGRGVVSTFVEGKEDSALLGPGDTADTYGPSPWAVWTGTSFAAPQIAGALSRLIRGGAGRPRRTPLDAVEALKDIGSDEYQNQGYGIAVKLLLGT